MSYNTRDRNIIFVFLSYLHIDVFRPPWRLLKHVSRSLIYYQNIAIISKIKIQYNVFIYMKSVRYYIYTQIYESYKYILL